MGFSTAALFLLFVLLPFSAPSAVVGHLTSPGRSHRSLGQSSFLMAFSFAAFFSSASTRLTPHFYNVSCPNLLRVVDSVVGQAMAKEPRMGASLLRLHYLDCFVVGCDASNLLEGTTENPSEKTAKANNNSARGYEVVDLIKSAVESECPGTVSCADILAIAARDSVVRLGGPNWAVELGRRDSLAPSKSMADGDLLSPNADLGLAILMFKKKGLEIQQMVALLGAHTIGYARCENFRERIYNIGVQIEPDFFQVLRFGCPEKFKGYGDDYMAALDLSSPLVFGNEYYESLANDRGLLLSDQHMFNATAPSETDAWVEKYRKSPSTFSLDFVTAIMQMGNIRLLTESMGQIRKNCRFPN